MDLRSSARRPRRIRRSTGPRWRSRRPHDQPRAGPRRSRRRRRARGPAHAARRRSPGSSASSPTRWLAAFPRRGAGVAVAAPVARGGPRLLGLGELEALRDDARRPARRRPRRARRARRARRRRRARCSSGCCSTRAATASCASPTPSSASGGCGVWQVRPRLGLIGMLMGWWQVKLSSGCPLAGLSSPWVGARRKRRRRSRKRAAPAARRGASGAPAPRAAPSHHARADGGGARRRRGRRSRSSSCPSCWLSCCIVLGFVAGGARRGVLLGGGFALVSARRRSSSRSASTSPAFARTRPCSPARRAVAVDVPLCAAHAACRRSCCSSPSAVAFAVAFPLLRPAFRRRCGRPRVPGLSADRARRRDARRMTEPGIHRRGACACWACTTSRAICADLERTTAFYRDVLGLALVREGVNDDDPDARHFWFGDADGQRRARSCRSWSTPSMEEARSGAGSTHHFALRRRLRRGARRLARLPALARRRVHRRLRPRRRCARSTCATPTATSSRSRRRRAEARRAAPPRRRLADVSGHRGEERGSASAPELAAPARAAARASSAASARRWRSVIEPTVLFSDIGMHCRNLRHRVCPSAAGSSGDRRPSCSPPPTAGRASRRPTSISPMRDAALELRASQPDLVGALRACMCCGPGASSLRVHRPPCRPSSEGRPLVVCACVAQAAAGGPP